MMSSAAVLETAAPPVTTTLQSGGLRTELVVPAELTAADRAAWDALFTAQTGIANPFCAPVWVETWYEHFTRAADRVMVVVRDGTELVGVAPLYRRSVGRGRARIADRLLLAGAGQGGSLLELPQVLTAAGQERPVLRAVTAEILRDQASVRGVRWAEIAVARQQGWFEPNWVAGTNQPVAFYRQHTSRASVVVPLAGSWALTRSGLKRNVKESLRRSRNRLTKQPKPWSVRPWTDDLDDSVVDRFLALHRDRAELDVSARHNDAFVNPARRAFLRDLLPRLGRQGRASILELVLDDEVVASQLVLHAPGLTYLHSSGFRPEVWDLGAATFLQGDAVAAAADRGERWVNMSPGPNLAKLRWSEQLDVHDDFAFGCGSRSLRSRYAAFSAAQAVAQVWRAAHLEPRGHDA